MEAKLEKTLELINNIMVDPDIDLEYEIPANGDPVILVHYSEDKYVTRKIKLTEKYLSHTPEEIANLVTFSIEQFKEELDSVHMS
jgi:hypothetical protein